MALNFFKRRDIEQMDINDIPEEFINYFETLDDRGKVALVGTRPDLAKALGFVLPQMEEQETTVSATDESDIASADTVDSASEDQTLENDLDGVTQEELEEDDSEDELSQIRQNFYEGKNLDLVLTNDMPEIEALAIPDGATICMLHRTPLEKKDIKFKNGPRGLFGIVPRICRSCHRVYLEESKMLYIHDWLVERGIPHTFYDLDLTTSYLRSLMPVHEFSDDELLYVPDTWVEEDPRCPIHGDELYEAPCAKTYEDRVIQFTAYRCDRCRKYLIRRAASLDLVDRCAENGIPLIGTERLVKKKPVKKPIPPREINSDYLIENGQRTAFRHNITSNCYRLSESDTVVVSDSIYCTIDGHDDIEEVAALIWVLHKRGERKAYLFRLGYCNHCQKYYMAQEDYQVLYPIGRPEVTILRDIDDTDFQITSGEVFNIERDHLADVEKQISDEEQRIRNSPDFVSPFATGDYDDGGLAFAKEQSMWKYGPRLQELSEFTPKPYSYRVDISLEDTTETYYIGASDIYLNGKLQVISANSDFGHDLVNYQTIKVQKEGKEYNIKLSRQFEINNAYLYGYVNLRTDEDIIFKSGITDPFLVRVLNMRKRQHNLTDIFVTIQENQNKIVNTPFSRNIIVQGCTGSGKTMVLLHRLSSLNYKERAFSFSRDALILTPNDQFTTHIKGLAEELQIGSIQRASVEQYYIDTLLLYSPDFKLDGKVSSEMIVRQGFVDFIYSDQFRELFNAAYDKVIEKRNALAETLENLQSTMQQPARAFDLSEDSRVIQQMKYAVDSMRSKVESQESEISTAIDKYQQLMDRKRFLKDRIQSLETTSVDIINECVPRVNAKIGIFLSERQHTISELENQIETLNREYEEVQRRIFLFRKRERLEELDKQVKAAERKLKTENARQEEELPVLSMSMEGLPEDEKLAWMRQVMLIIPEVRDEVHLCNNMREELQRFTEEFSGIDEKIEAALAASEEKKAGRYSDEVKKGIIYLYTELEKYSMLGTFQQIFELATTPYRKEHHVMNIQGKYHRYDLYARLLFAMRYFGKTVGTTRFMCVDEGQDLALNEYRLLKELNEGQITFNVFGDTNQLMKPGRGISDWTDLQKAIGAEKYELNENYRNTNQITRFCNSSFEMNVTQTGVDGVNVREIPRKELESELAALTVTTERIAILVPRGVQKNRYIKTEELPSSINEIIGDTMENGFISLMYVDEVKGIEFDKAYVVGNKMSRNEKYIAYTRALSELILVVDEKIDAYDDGSLVEGQDKKSEMSQVRKKRKVQKKKGVLNYKVEEKISENNSKPV